MMKPDNNKLKNAIKSHGPYIFIISIVSGIIIGYIGRFYYAFSFLPEYHGSWFKSLFSIWNLDGWLTYIKSPLGIIFNGAFALLCFVIPGLLFLIVYLSNKEK